MTTKLAELRKTPETATPQTILAMCDLLEQMRNALAYVMCDEPNLIPRASSRCRADLKPALAAFDKFNGGE